MNFLLAAFLGIRFIIIFCIFAFRSLDPRPSLCLFNTSATRAAGVSVMPLLSSSVSYCLPTILSRCCDCLLVLFLHELHHVQVQGTGAPCHTCKSTTTCKIYDQNVKFAAPFPSVLEFSNYAQHQDDRQSCALQAAAGDTFTSWEEGPNHGGLE